jgi:ribosome-dependent ATPase
VTGRIQVTGVSHRYRRVRALDEVTVEIPAGRIAGLIGPDGVGKSTLLGLIAGARRLQSGSVRALGGEIGDAAHRRAVCARIAYMPQGLGRNLYAELSVRENLDFFGRLFGRRAAEREERIARLLAATGLAPFADRPVGKLSGGMKQKLGLCCALIHDPDLLILDEPTTGVDPPARGQFWDLVGSIRTRRPGMSVLVSTAYMEEAERFDWLAAMDGGRVLATGTPAELIARTGAATLEAAYRTLRSGAPRPPLRRPRGTDAGPPVISARGLTRRFGDFIAVDDVSFDIARGEVFGFIGSNGCGKSTTMRMLTGLLPPSSGEARLFDRPLGGDGRAARRRIGYMSQGFSLYGELTVRQNLELHARLFALPPGRRRPRIAELVARFGLAAHLDQPARALPLGVRQRLSLAVAVIHEPPLLILDEPTSGVDPEARDAFWDLLFELSRDHGVTIFISTHFMTEAERCDRVALMHAGRVLACDTPARLVAAAGAHDLEEAFVTHLRAAEPTPPDASPPASTASAPPDARFSFTRLAAYARRESLELVRDPVRLAFAFFGSALLMVVFCYGISLDVRDLGFAVLDLDRTPASRGYVAAFEGSPYFAEGPPLASAEQAARRLAIGAASLTLEIPPGFGRDLAAGARPEVLAVVDGALPFKGETVEGYASGVHAGFLADLARDAGQRAAELARIEPRFRYNPSFESINAMAPAMPAILLVMLPAILTAVSVTRERELGTIANFHATPTTRLEFLAGKQLPYIAIAFLNFLLLSAMTALLFGVPMKGDGLALAAGAALFVWGTTAFGLVISALTASQVTAVFATALISLIPTLQFSGLLQPVSTLDTGAQAIGRLWPASYFLHLNVGAFTKGLGWPDLMPDILALAAFGPAFTLIAAAALRKQER